jgi:hypothetical protein
MALDRQLIEEIKTNFARKSSSQLQEVVQSGSLVRWSREAAVAANEVLKERADGRAEEPLVPEKEPPPPLMHFDGTKVALFGMLMMGGLASGVLVHPVFLFRNEDRPDPDLPVPFGPNMAWLALDSPNTESVAAALGLRDVKSATWAEGIHAANHASFFISPPLGDWTLVTSTALFIRQRVDAAVKLLVEGLSRQFRDAQYFCTHRDEELHIWARARQGQLVRGYGWDGKKRLTLWDEGKQTKEERDLGFEFFNPDSISASPIPDSKVLQVPDETCVMQLASLWSIDPTTLDESFKEPATGLVGDAGRGQ